MAIAAEEGQMVENTYFPGNTDLSQLSEGAKSALLSQELKFGPGSKSTLKVGLPEPMLTCYTNDFLASFALLIPRKTSNS